MTSEAPKQHLNPFSLFYYAYKGILNWGIFALIALPSQRTNFWVVIGTLLSLVIIIGLLKFFFFTFQIGGDMITINSGIFVKRHTHIPYGRIQTIQRSQWFFLKPLHLEQLKIETAGHESHRPEVTLPVVSESVREEIERKRLAVKGNSTMPGLTTDQSAKPAVDSSISITATHHYEINPHDLNVFALTSFGILPLMGVLAAVYGKIQEYIPKHFLNTVTKEIISQSILIISGIVLLIVIIAVVGSYFSLVQKYYKFTLTSESNQLKTYQGLFQRKSVTIPINRIQALRVKQNVLRQWAKISTVQALAASSAGDDDKGNDMMILPVIKTHDVFNQLKPFVSWAPDQFISLERLPKRHYFYFIRNAILWTLIPIAGCIYFFRLWGAFSLLLLIIAFFLGWYSSSNTGWQLHGDQLIMQSGWLFTRTEFIIPKKNVQSFSLNQSIWMSHKKLAHLRVNVRHGNHNEQVEIRYVPFKDAEKIFNWLRIRN
ncbi:PH domain-containing protein [Lentilactobacillus hilgardii]|uniref:YdbS-like PH domain-containing protein n=1 Tax=Lentilactobacillus hilgardii (strain ATCC 8290 / DSM 20176 / CCUG 30140 / JCM 1155 / KCTC 3500 / NBRC 15886 / NCIMB 8040 / NRRL B-1843 / 9) TaxID=1423757 RepID=C0XJQ1_LENH9|nr:PH domain-containing protein [Lentilactobacillus hilgardii]EEI24380.1 hypothetical protein HMPREF0519_1462 [Lentilactobacillus hilgardii DSM 20176 = ATCC 8290]KRK58978.1 membrane protein [Lentilactobacillus hilgardii DSM 20176 = ATCC 8290]QEU37810.1 PH domain-containing protein [Lentilactobacillus hilgardii]TDG81437.1 hypothetical protein C5L34_002489 [Lentilactobacillus hilgardii]